MNFTMFSVIKITSMKNLFKSNICVKLKKFLWMFYMKKLILVNKNIIYIEKIFLFSKSLFNSMRKFK